MFTNNYFQNLLFSNVCLNSSMLLSHKLLRHVSVKKVEQCPAQTKCNQFGAGQRLQVRDACASLLHNKLRFISARCRSFESSAESEPASHTFKLINQLIRRAAQGRFLHTSVTAHLFIIVPYCFYLY